MIRETGGAVRNIDHEGNWHVLVWGLPRPEKPLSLAAGLTIRPLDSPLTVCDLAAAGAEGFNAWAVLGPIARNCTAEVESARDSDTTPGYDTLNRAWLAASLLVLRGFTRHMCVALSSYSWNLVAGHQKRTKERLPPFKGKLLDFYTTLHLNGAAKSQPLTQDDATWIKAHFLAFNKLASESESFRFALEAATDWRYATDTRAAVSRLWAGIEAIFGIKTELVHRISLNSACLLAKRGAERTKRFHAVKELYDLRSKAVHGAGLSDEKLMKAVSESFDLLSALLMNAISRGRLPTSEDIDHVVFEE
ncbi:MAG: HEPN domain-containing protein [Elusimicrobia bacterium]|nr:HEPN domain-containing protein [Elusimicrobiota bacterium]